MDLSSSDGRVCTEVWRFPTGALLREFIVFLRVLNAGLCSDFTGEHYTGVF